MDSRTYIVTAIWTAVGAAVVGLFYSRFRISRATSVRARLTAQIGLATWTLISLVVIVLGAVAMLSVRMMNGDRESLWLALLATAFASYMFYRIFLIRKACVDARKKLGGIIRILVETRAGFIPGPARPAGRG